MNSIVLSGGLVLNGVFIDNLNEILHKTKITVLKESAYLEAFEFISLNFFFH